MPPPHTHTHWLIVISYFWDKHYHKCTKGSNYSISKHALGGLGVESLTVGMKFQLSNRMTFESPAVHPAYRSQYCTVC